MADMGRPIGGGGDGPRAQWWKDYYSDPTVKEKRAKYMRERRKKQKEAVLKQWTHPNEPPNTNRNVLIAVVIEGDKLEWWVGYYEDDGWYTAEGEPVFVKGWMEGPLLPGQVPE